MKKYPLLLATTLYASGVVAGGFLAVEYKWWLFGGICVAALGWGMERLRLGCVLILLPLTGAALFASRAQIVSPVDLRLIAGAEPKLASIKGELLETPSYTRYYQKGRERFRTSCRLRLRQVQFDKGPVQPSEGSVLITLPGRLSESFFRGRQAAVDGVLSYPAGAMAEGLFDYRKYLAGQGIHYQLQTRQTNDWTLLDSERTRGAADRFLSWGQKVTALGLPEEDAEVHLLWAMSLGWRPGLNSDSSVPFVKTGTMHIFAISGLHVALIAAILVQVLRFIRIPRGACAGVIIPLIWFYTAATGWQSSAIRSTLMSSVVVLGWSLKRPSNLLNSLMASALLILIWQPEQLFQASFQLSFFVVLSMALLLPARSQSGAVNESPSERLSRSRWLGWLGSHPLTWREQGWKPGPFVRWWRGDELLPPQLEPAWLQAHRRASTFVVLSLATCLAAWLGSLPLIMYYFAIVTPISLLANLFIVPLSSLALTCNLAALCTGEWLAFLTSLFNHAAWFFMLLLEKLSDLLASWRWGYFYVRQPGTAAIFSYYVFLVAAAAGFFTRRRLRYFSLGALAISAAIYSLPVMQNRNAICLTVLPTEGAAVLIEDRAAGESTLINAGDERGAKGIINPFLHTRGINAIDRLVIAHASVRQVGGMSSVLSDTPPANVIISEQKYRSAPYKAAVREVENRRIPLLRAKADEVIGRWHILGAARGEKVTAADDSPLVLKGEYGGLRMLLLSELGSKGQQALLANHAEELKTDLLIAGMPLRGEPLTPVFLEAAAPKVIVLCTSEYPASNRGNAKLRQRLESYGAPIYYCDESKAVTITVRPDRFRLSTMAGEVLEWGSEKAPKVAQRFKASTRRVEEGVVEDDE